MEKRKRRHPYKAEKQAGGGKCGNEQKAATSVMAMHYISRKYKGNICPH